MVSTAGSNINMQHDIRLEPDINQDEIFQFHSRTVEDCLRYLDSQIEGLSDQNVSQRREALSDKDTDKLKFTRSRELLLGGLKNTTTYLLIAASLLSAASGETIQALMIFAALLTNIAIHGLIQIVNQKKQTTVEETDFQTIRIKAKRNGQLQSIMASELVTGDIVSITAGMVLPVDGRLLQSDNLQLDEAVLTGESIMVPKNAYKIHTADEEVTHQSNMVFAGTRIKTGDGLMVVTAMGNESVMGQIANLTDKTRKALSPFAKGLMVMTRRVMLAAFVVASFTLAVEYQRGTDVLHLAQFLIIMAVAALPSALPAISSLILSLGISRSNSEKILVKNLNALESLGDITVLCSDKTGTLTENQLIFNEMFLPTLNEVDYNEAWQNGNSTSIPHRSIEQFLRVCRLNNDTVMNGIRGAIMGDPIDVALFRAAPASVEEGYRKKHSIPFDGATLKSAAIYEDPEGRLVSMVKGAPEAVLECCAYKMNPDGTISTMSVMDKADLIVKNRQSAMENNYRIIGIAQKLIELNDEQIQNANPYENAIFIGWVCLSDPPKPGVQQAISDLHRTGVRTMMITGDQKATAETTARELGILTDEYRNDVMEKHYIWQRAQLEDSDGQIPDTVRVFARTKPEEKLYIVESIQNSGHIVAMVGDGVNDAPALQKSDVAIAMGYKGSDAAKDSADILLLADRMDGILIAIKVSRLLRKKLQASVQYIVSCNLGLLFYAGAGILIGNGAALSTLQILWLTMVMVTFPTLALGMEPLYLKGDMPKRNAQPDNIVNSTQSKLMMHWALSMMSAGLITSLVSHYVLHLGADATGTMAFTSMAFALGLNLLPMNYYQAGGDMNQAIKDIATAPVSWIVMLVVITLQVAAIYTPFLNMVFGTVPLALPHILMAAGIPAFTTFLCLQTMEIKGDVTAATSHADNSHFE